MSFIVFYLGPNMISVSIVTYNNSIQEVRRCLSDFISHPLINELVICENSEGLLLDENELSQISNKIKYVPNPQNTGYGAGHNKAISCLSSNSKYHVVMNLDVVVNAVTFQKLFNFMESDSSVIHVMPKILNHDGSVQRLCKRLPTPINLIARRFIKSEKLIGKIDKKYTLSDYNYDYILDCPYLSGCFMFLKRSAFEGVGGFDERFFMYPEDIDLTRRLHEIGRTICYPYVSVIHEHGQASYKSIKMLSIHITGMTKYFNKWGWFFDSGRKKMNADLEQRIYLRKSMA